MGFPCENVEQDKETTTLEIFAFRANPPFTCRFSFPPPSTTPSTTPCGTHHKRGRPLADVDGDGSGQKKKRRLRLCLVTSRLSRPFSAPPTHIVSRGSSKIAVWAKQKALGRNLLRKVAILNRIKRISLAANAGEQMMDVGLDRGVARQMFMYDYSATVVLDAVTDLAEKDERHTRPFGDSPAGRRQTLPLPPSPLGLSNYDAFDNEDGYFDGEGEEGASMVYSDFNVLEPCEPVVDDHDSLSAFDSDPSWGRLVPLQDENMMEIIKEKERQKEISFVRFEI